MRPVNESANDLAIDDEVNFVGALGAPIIPEDYRGLVGAVLPVGGDGTLRDVEDALT